MQSYYPVTAARPGCTHNYYSVAACICLTAGRNDKSHALAWWMTDRLSAHLLRFFFPRSLFYMAVIWVHRNAVSLLSAAVYKSKSSWKRKGVSTPPGQCQCTPFLQDTSIMRIHEWKLLFTEEASDDLDVKTTEGCTVLRSWPELLQDVCVWAWIYSVLFVISWLPFKKENIAPFVSPLMMNYIINHKWLASQIKSTYLAIKSSPQPISHLLSVSCLGGWASFWISTLN